MKIINLYAREILDSRGCPTIETEVALADGTCGLGQAPSGASTGSTEAIEIRDGDKKRYWGKGVLKAIEIVKTEIKKLLVGQDAYDQKTVDQLMIAADNSENKSRLGGNVLVSVSTAVCRAAAQSQKIPLYKYFGKLSGNKNFQLPQPLILLLEGGKHGNWATDIQEYFVIPKKEAFTTFYERLRAGAEIFHALGEVLKEKGYALSVGYEGAFCPREIRSNKEAFQLMMEACQKAGYSFPNQVVLGIDAAASEFYQDGKYILHSEGDVELTSRQWTDKVIQWTKDYPIWSVEDVHSENDWNEWIYFTSRLGNKLQIVGDDLLTTNVNRIKKAVDKKAVNSVLIKPNQVGTVSETIAAIKLSHSADYTTVVSHRGGETNDDMIADLVVGSSSWQCKFGGPDRGERVAKYNRLLKIEEELKSL